jgi:hypothetical protein
MHRTPSIVRRTLVATAALATLYGGSVLIAQSDSSVPVTAGDRSASISNVHRHVTFAKTEVGKSADRARTDSKPASTAKSNSAKPNSSAAKVASEVFGFFPGDLVYMGGPVVTEAESHPVYVNANHNTGGCRGVEDCWGDPEAFLQDLGRSILIHVVDQYTGETGNRRYTLGDSVRLTTAPGTIFDNQLFALIHSAAKREGSGYEHIYHIFLPPGTDTCFIGSDGVTPICYSPDNPNSFFFCAYHGSVDFSDIGHVLYTVQPYQNVPGCYVSQPSPNGQLADSTDSVLSHETIETITDPDGTGWWNLTGGALGGEEIADECVSLVDQTSAALDPTFTIGRHQYEVQLEYSNTYHACINVP